MKLFAKKKMADSAMSAYSVKLVAVSGREQPVVLKVKRDGLWLYTEHGKVRGGATDGAIVLYSSTASAAVSCCGRQLIPCSHGIIASAHPQKMQSLLLSQPIFSLDRLAGDSAATLPAHCQVVA
jgi:hypothetical protein